LQRGQFAVFPALRVLTLSFCEQCGQANRMGMATRNIQRLKSYFDFF